MRQHIVVSGRVQGVGYRFFVIEEAERLGLNGWVRNLPDGKVESEVEGSQEAVDELVKQLKVGPRLSRVIAVDIERMDTLAHFTDFQVR